MSSIILLDIHHNDLVNLGFLLRVEYDERIYYKSFNGLVLEARSSGFAFEVPYDYESYATKMNITCLSELKDVIEALKTINKYQEPRQ